jgi:serine/threonine protein phosphatase PrpC
VKVRWRAAGASDVGRVRKGNEDAFLLDEARGVFLVADGMGGHAAGEIASAIATRAVGDTLLDGVDRGLPPDDLALSMVDSFRAADHAIAKHVATHPDTAGMGTTVTAMVLRPDGTYRMGHIGDSRAYLLRDGQMAQLSRDHTWVQREVDEGRLTPSAARKHPYSHILTRALGADSSDDPELQGGELCAGDRLLLCSDGLTGMVTDAALSRILQDDSAPDERVRQMIAAANRRGGRDNITAIIVDVLPHD